ncbi:MAG: restriction endonuclease [Rubrivivax sp.]
MATRADRIEQILREEGGRARVAQIARTLSEREGVGELASATVSATVAQDNKIRDLAGRALRFNTYGDGGEEWGFVSLRTPAPPVKEAEIAKLHGRIPQAIEAENAELRKKLKDAIAKLSWQDFEANFLVRVLDALGFHSIELTQLTRDGGKDATCKYKRGIVTSEAIVSAKHWQGAKVPISEVQRLRGLKGNADTGIIVTSSSFTADAQKEAEPSQNQRAIVLVDGDLIVETCVANSIGVRPFNLPRLYEFVGFKDTGEGAAA